MPPLFGAVPPPVVKLMREGYRKFKNIGLVLVEDIVRKRDGEVVCMYYALTF